MINYNFTLWLTRWASEYIVVRVTGHEDFENQQDIERVIAGRMRALRQSLGWTAMELSQACDKQAAPRKSTLTRGRIAKLECGAVAGFRAAELADLAAVFNITVDNLMGLSEAPAATDLKVIPSPIPHTVAPPGVQSEAVVQALTQHNLWEQVGEIASYDFGVNLGIPPT